jgi:hypothetical protein
MTDYSPESIQIGGTTATIRSAASGDKLTNPSDHSRLRVNNGSGAPITLTITVPGTTIYGETNPTKVITITNATAKYIPIPAVYGNPADAGKVALTWSATATITFEYTRD